MPNFLVTFDLLDDAASVKYQSIDDAIKALGGRRVQDSVWWIADESNRHTPESLVNHLAVSVNRQRDRLIVARFDSFDDWAGFGSRDGGPR